MKPYPFASLNHLTVPCAIRLYPLSLGGDGRPLAPRHHGWGFPRDRGEQQKSDDEGPGPSRRSHSLEAMLAHVRKEPDIKIPKSRSRNRAQVSKPSEALSRLFLEGG